MSDEKPVILSKRKVSVVADDSQLICIVHYERSKDTEVRPLSDNQFRTICDAVQIRQSQPVEGNRLDSICASIPAQRDEVQHGAHRWCYKNFTNVSRLTGRCMPVTAETADDVITQARKSVRSVGSNLQSTLFPQDECLFCGKRCKTAHRSKEPLTKCETETAQNIIKECATDRQDFKLLGKIDGVDMLAKEARYHESCRRNYVRRDDRHSPASSNLLQ